MQIISKYKKYKSVLGARGVWVTALCKFISDSVEANRGRRGEPLSSPHGTQGQWLRVCATDQTDERERERSKQSSRKKEALNYEVWARWQHLARDWQPPSFARFVRQEEPVLSQRLSTCQSPSLPSLAVFDCLCLSLSCRSVCLAAEISTSVSAVQWTCCNVMYVHSVQCTLCSTTLSHYS